MFYDRQPILVPYVKLFDILDDNGKPLVDPGPKRAFRAGAVIAERAYVESGYELPIHDLETFNFAHWDAKLEGIPESYIIKSVADSALQGLIAVMLDAPNMQAGSEKYGSYEYFIPIGAGLTRHYLQFEIKLNG